MDFISIFLFSIPVFYVWGLISFIRFLGRVKTTDPLSRRAYLETAIADLQKELTKNPDKKLSELLSSYQEELKHLPVEAAESVPSTEKATTANMSLQIPKPPQHSGASVQNWYKDNSINLLLYVGAFLIVVSATIYVSLPNTSGVSKGLVLSALTLVFLLSGLWFYTMPRIKNAGTAFTAIGALLIPVAGLGWYNFVFKHTHVSFGIVWILTSIIGLFVYIVLARYFRSVFYSYVTGFSTLSFVLAFFNMQGLQNDFYVLGAILSSIVLLAFSLYLKKQENADSALFLQPFAITANITMPVAIAYALFLTSETTHFTLESTASVLLGCFFYLLSYRYFKKSVYLFAAQILFTLGLIYLGFWLHMNTVNVMYLLMGSLCANLSLVMYFNNRKKEEETIIAAIFSIIKPSIIFFFAWATDIATPHLLIFACITMLIGILLTHIRKNAWYLSLTSIFLSIAMYILLVEQFKYDDKLFVVGIVYTVIATAWYAGAVHVRNNRNELAVCVFSSIYFFALSTFFIGESWRYQLFNTITMTVVAYSAVYQFKAKQIVYAGNVIVAFTVYTLLQLTRTHIEFYPLVFSALSLVFYLISAVLTYGPHEEFKNSGLVGAVLSPIVFGIYTFNYNDDTYYDNGFSPAITHRIEQYALFSSYMAFVLYGFDAFSRKSSSMGYTASVIGLLTYLWQINFLGVKETQYYTFVIGAYFFTLSYIQRRKPDSSLKTIFDVTATFFLFVPTWFQTSGDKGAIYALILGMIGVAYLVYSITYQDKFYRYMGILGIVLAVISQSKWAIIGLAGLFFLGFAVYLLIYRKEEPQQKN